jgi:hypothetical protein
MMGTTANPLDFTEAWLSFLQTVADGVVFQDRTGASFPPYPWEGAACTLPQLTAPPDSGPGELGG